MSRGHKKFSKEKGARTYEKFRESIDALETGGSNDDIVKKDEAAGGLDQEVIWCLRATTPVMANSDLEGHVSQIVAMSAQAESHEQKMFDVKRAKRDCEQRNLEVKSDRTWKKNLCFCHDTTQKKGT